MKRMIIVVIIIGLFAFIACGKQKKEKSNMDMWEEAKAKVQQQEYMSKAPNTADSTDNTNKSKEYGYSYPIPQCTNQVQEKCEKKEIKIEDRFPILKSNGFWKFIIPIAITFIIVGIAKALNLKSYGSDYYDD